MKVLVVYYSKTGNTKLISNTIHETASINHESTLLPIDKCSIDNLNNYDLLFVGSACHDATLAKPMREFLKSLPNENKFVFAGFYTHSTTLPNGTARNKQLFNDWAGHCEEFFEKTSLDKNIQYLGAFHCQGKASFLIEKFIKYKVINNRKEWKIYKKELRLHPTESELESAKEFTKGIIEKYQLD